MWLRGLACAHVTKSQDRAARRANMVARHNTAANVHTCFIHVCDVPTLTADPKTLQPSRHCTPPASLYCRAPGPVPSWAAA
eukprot:1274660-Rhodomonas_salina.2